MKPESSLFEAHSIYHFAIIDSGVADLVVDRRETVPEPYNRLIVRPCFSPRATITGNKHGR